MSSSSARMAHAIRAGLVIIQNRTHAEVTVRYLSSAKTKERKFLGPLEKFELCPKHCPPQYVRFSNVSDLQKRRSVRVLKVEKDD